MEHDRDFIEQSCAQFVAALASKAPVPGGGGACALVGAIGMALGNMVGSLTLGKPKYAAVQADILRLQTEATGLQGALLALVARDAAVFEPLSRAYGLPTGTQEESAHKARVMEAALNEAARVPLELMELCCKAIGLHEEFAAKGTAIAISDVGVGALLCGAALQGAALNVFINTKYMADRDHAAGINAQAKDMLHEYAARAGRVYEDVAARLQ
ncbi:MAG: cyclodeaminase/cyclohydrolase family protein [Christensenellaceae bacterium]|jgi:formiminotetrahydrofolate cyclodeaminase|nr:cyclodeaminase/cyclohydrolase family protein [Christensenellaceae bacterium]